MSRHVLHHIGLIAPDQDTPIPHTFWVVAGRLWVSNPADHSQAVEWLRYAPDATVSVEFQSRPHKCVYR